MDTADLCMALMRADYENEVVDLLRQAGYWEADECWRLLGDGENNFATIGNQQSEAIAALVEKIINSIDARLTNACLLAEIDPTSDKAPQSIREAVARFFEPWLPDGRGDGRISEWLDSDATREGRLLTVAATGAMPRNGNPSITIADQGEGQTPDDFPNTFMSLAHNNKLRIPFVQGRFNMGGTGALQFCGVDHRVQLVVSRRNQALLPASPGARDREWGFTVVRREPPPPGTRSSVYKYLAPVDTDLGGGVLSFLADSWPIFPEANNKVRNAYHRRSEYGSLVKLYEYEWQGTKSNIVSSGGGLLNRIGVGLPEIALPVRLFECRPGFRGHAGSFATNALGLVARLERDRGRNLEPAPFGLVSGAVDLAEQRITIRAYVFLAGKARQYRLPRYGLVFAINGQTHGALSTDFFRRKSVRMGYLADSLLVVVDCTSIDGKIREDLFMNSRDRLRDTPLARMLESRLAEFLRQDPTLREIQNRRRQAAITERLEDDKPLIDTLQDVLRRNPTFSRILLQGQNIPSPFNQGGGSRKGVHDKFNGKRIPTFVRFKGKRTGQQLLREARVGSGVNVTLETDAEDEYFTRSSEAGNFAFERRTNEGFVGASGWTMTGPKSGIIHLRLDPLVEVGEADYRIRVIDPSHLRFTNRLRLIVKEEGGKEARKKRRHRQRRRRNAVRNEDEGRLGGRDDLNVPEIVLVEKADWWRHDFTEESALRVEGVATNGTSETVAVKGERTSIYDFYVNIDNKYLLSEQKEDPRDGEIIRKQFVYGMVILGLAMVQRASDSSNGDVERMVRHFTAAVAPILLPMLRDVGGLVGDED